jgi:hypothetical protein
MTQAPATETELTAWRDALQARREARAQPVARP